MFTIGTNQGKGSKNIFEIFILSWSEWQRPTKEQHFKLLKNIYLNVLKLIYIVSQCQEFNRYIKIFVNGLILVQAQDFISLLN